jgi:hypothetical protein
MLGVLRKRGKPESGTEYDSQQQLINQLSVTLRQRAAREIIVAFNIICFREIMEKGAYSLRVGPFHQYSLMIPLC